MGWLIGIICVVLVIFFWWIFIPLGIFVGIVFGGFMFWASINDDKRDAKEAREVAAFKNKVSTARANATSQGKEWKVRYEEDPASGKNIARKAYIVSNDNLCNLGVEKRLNGADLTDLRCYDFKIPSYKDIEVKFDNYNNSNTMRLEKYTDSEDSYIPPNQYSNHLSYNEFIKRLKNGKAVAIKIPVKGDTIWITFTLNGASKALDALGNS